MSRSIATVVHISEVFGNQIDVMKDETIERIVLLCFDEAHVEQRTSVEWQTIVLMHDEDHIVEQLLLQKRMEIVEKEAKVHLPVAMADDDGDALLWTAVRREEVSTLVQWMALFEDGKGRGDGGKGMVVECRSVDEVEREET